MKCLNTTRGAHESNAEVTSYTHENLTPDTTYYILVPNGNPDLTQGIRGTRDSGDTIPNPASYRKLGLVPRLPRVVLPGYVHHITQRGVRRGDLFFRVGDRSLYLHLMRLHLMRLHLMRLHLMRLHLMREGTEKFEVQVLCYCLMTKPVPLLALPRAAHGLARAIGEAHRRYTLHTNRRRGATGYLFQGRFASCPLGLCPLSAAAR